MTIGFTPEQLGTIEAALNAADAAIRQLQAENEALRKDAERWRAMREGLVSVDWNANVSMFELHSGVVSAGPEGADAIADAAIMALK
jgi:hypothetical protein